MDIGRGLRWAQIFDPDEDEDEDHDHDDKSTPPIEISGMEPLYRKMMNMKNVQNFIPDMMGQKFLASDRNFCHF